MGNKDNIINKIVASGRVVSLNEKNGTCYITIASKNGRDIYPKFVCSKDIVPELPTHARVKIEGHVESGTKKNKDNKQWLMSQKFIADKVSLDTTMTEEAFGIKGKFFAPPEVNIYLKGTIIGITDDTDWFRYTIKIEGSEDKKTTVRVSMKKLDRHPDVKEGDNVCAICAVTTPKKQVNGRICYFEDILVSDLVKVQETS